jgi:hypothetical protein
MIDPRAAAPSAPIAMRDRHTPKACVPLALPGVGAPPASAIWARPAAFGGAIDRRGSLARCRSGTVDVEGSEAPGRGGRQPRRPADAASSRWPRRAADAGGRPRILYAQPRRPGSRGGSPSRKVRTSQGRVVGNPTRGNPRESATETHRRWRGASRAQVRVKRCGKSAPAPWRHVGQANPTRCKAKQDRSQAARRGPGRPLRWMTAQRQNPAYRLATERPRFGGVFLCVARRVRYARPDPARSGPIRPDPVLTPPAPRRAGHVLSPRRSDRGPPAHQGAR